MKKLITLSVFLLFYSNCFSQWYWQNPSPQGNELLNVHFFNQQTCVAIGNSGTVVKSYDGGNNWFNVQADTNNYSLNSISYIDSLNWWATGNGFNIVLKTTNGGMSWSLLTNLPFYWQFNSICFLNLNTGYIVSNSTFIEKTTNGGLTWDNQSIETPNTLKSIHFINYSTGYVVGNSGSIFKTTNGGVNWNTQVSGSSTNLTSVNFINSQTGWTLGESSIIIGTTNGGDNWTVHTLGSYISTTRCFHFVNSQTGWVSALKSFYPLYYYSCVSRTTDGGNVWIEQETQYSINSITFINLQTGIAVGTYGNILKTTNSGMNWYNEIHGTRMRFLTINFINSQTGWATGDEGIIYKTTNGGNNWDSLSKVSINLTNIFFINSQTGWTVGGSVGGGSWRIYNSTNGGLNWNLQASTEPGGNGLNFVRFINSQTGFAVGFDIILKTTNSGTNWIYYPDSSEYDIYNQIQFINSQTGFIYGNQKLLKTTNQGNNWFQIPGSADNGFFINAQTGWINTRFNIKKTTDGGNNWSSQLSTSGNETFQSIYFINLQTGFASNNMGSIFKTSNGGQNWTLQRKTQYYLKSIFFADSLTGWIVGDRGTILKTTNGGNSTKIININNNITETYSIFQNYPNPFNPFTNIKFQIKQSGFTQLKVFDILGKEIETLVNEKMQTGTYEIQFNGNDLPSGIYFYRIQSGNFVETKKMVLIK